MLSIVIPALNEEQSIESICKRCLAEAPAILEATGEEIEILVLDDGSTDRTAALASAIDGVRVHSFPHNRGYGAALMEGFRRSEGEYVSFLDADGTCDPKYFIPLLQAVKDGASVALGNRLGDNSEMPAVRRLGNRFFAGLIRLLSGAEVLDSASGMRVIRREALDLLYPLPTGLHFTPAMSCRAALDPRLSLVEVPMTYAEREGRSKLGVVRDGLRFLRVILEIAIQYRPLLLFGALGAVQLALGTLYAISPVLDFLRDGSLPEDRFYRVLTILVLFVGGFAFVYAGALADRAKELVNPPRTETKTGRFLRGLFFARPFLLAFTALVLALALNFRALLQYLSHGSIEVHWAFIAAGALLSIIALQLMAFGLLQRVLTLLAQRASDSRPMDHRSESED